jgi:hypothetical protein
MRKMKTTCKGWLPAVAGLTMALLTVPGALAQCGAPTKTTMGHPASWTGPMGRAQLMKAEYGGNFLEVGEEFPPIVGMWHVLFTAKGNTGPMAPPDGAPVDNAVVVWHADKTEIMNSGRPPQDGDFCLGVWEEVGHCHYKLNHFAWMGYDTTNAPEGIGKPAGPTHITEDVTVSSDGKTFTGSFTLDAYDTSGNDTHIVGELKGTRITMSTTVNDLM